MHSERLILDISEVNGAPLHISRTIANGDLEHATTASNQQEMVGCLRAGTESGRTEQVQIAREAAKAKIAKEKAAKKLSNEAALILSGHKEEPAQRPPGVVLVLSRSSWEC